MRVVITGAGGLLGRYLIDTNPSFEVIPFVRKQKGLKNEISIDLVSEESIEKISKLNPDIIIHLAAMTDVDRCEMEPFEAYKNNVVATRNVLVAAARFASVIVYISTDQVFNGTKKIYDEFDTPEPVNHYAKTKLIGEEFVKNLSDRFFIIRTSWLYGKYRETFPDSVIKKLKNKEVVYAADDFISSPTYAKQLSEKIWDVVTTQKYGVYHITNTGFTSRYKEAIFIAQKLGLEEKYIKKVKIDDLKLKARRPKNTVLKNLFLELNGFKTIPPWEEALEEYIQIRKKLA